MQLTFPNLTLVIDRRLYRPRKDSEPLSLVDAAILGGASLVQLRVPTWDSGADLALYAVALRLREMTAGRVPLVVTGDLELAERCHADGILLPERSYKPAAARSFLRSHEPFVGAYTHSVTGAARAERGGADYVQVGPVFTDRASEPSLQGIQLLRKVKDAIHLPVIAFGGVTGPEKAREAVRAGAAGVAVTHAILGAPDPERAAADIVEAISFVDHA